MSITPILNDRVFPHGCYRTLVKYESSGLELDFLVRFKGECVILEVKAKTGKAKSMTTVLKNNECISCL